MVKEDKNLTGNARFEGFCIDLLKWIAGQVGFQYAIRLVPDHMYGVYDPKTKEWNGIVRELMEKVNNIEIPYMEKAFTSGLSIWDCVNICIDGPDPCSWSKTRKLVEARVQ